MLPGVHVIVFPGELLLKSVGIAMQEVNSSINADIMTVHAIFAVLFTFIPFCTAPLIKMNSSKTFTAEFFKCPNVRH